MKLSKYVVFIPTEDGYLAYNTLTRSVLFLDQTTKDNLTKTADSIQSADLLTPLVEEKFLIPDSIDETQHIRTWLDEIRHTDTLNLTILTTYACNLACVYCIEEDVIKPIIMDSKTQEQVINWIKTQIIEKQILQVRLCFYGGEPLLNSPAIETIAQSIRGFCSQKEIGFYAELISNGVLLNPENAIKLVEWGISQVKITIDGDRIQHNRKRPAKNRADSYQVIINNIKTLPDELDLIISGNYDADNIASFPAMLDELAALGLSNRIKHISFKPILHTSQKASAVASQCASISFAESDLTAMVRLRNEAKSRGFNVPDYLVLGPCEFNFDYSLVIDPIGNFYKCAGFVGRPQFIIGDIKTGFNQRYYEFINVNIPEYCFDCIYMPSCGAGCRYCAQIKFGDYNQVVCEKPYFESVGQEILKSDYLMVGINEGS